MRAKDIMRAEVQYVSETTTLRELSRAFRHFGVTTLPVVDDQEQVVGVVTEAELLKAMLPGYAELHDDLTYMQDFEYLEDRAQSVENKPVREIMLIGVVSVNENSPLMRVISLFLLKSCSHIPVVRDDRIVGVVTRTDICELMFD
ncbi:MAG: CBS domain-containing protein [Anaerolineae bacterium]|nr:CBS domain-containing protein [Anaerolineae bacterium]